MGDVLQEWQREARRLAGACKSYEKELADLRARLAAMTAGRDRLLIEARLAAEVMRDVELALHRPGDAASRLASIAMAWSRYTTALAASAEKPATDATGAGEGEGDGE